MPDDIPGVLLGTVHTASLVAFIPASPVTHFAVDGAQAYLASLALCSQRAVATESSSGVHGPVTRNGARGTVGRARQGAIGPCSPVTEVAVLRAILSIAVLFLGLREAGNTAISSVAIDAPVPCLGSGATALGASTPKLEVMHEAIDRAVLFKARRVFMEIRASVAAMSGFR